MTNPMTRARVIGAVMLMLAFGAGIAVGHYLIPRDAPNGIMITMKGTTRIPDELEALSLSDTQRVAIRGFLREGTMRVGRIVREFAVPIDAAVDSTDRQIRSVLSVDQVRRLEDYRRDHPLRRMEEKRIIDTIR